MLDSFEKDAKERMEKSIQSLQQEFMQLRTGRAHPSVLSSVKVSYYGSDVPLTQVASVSIDGPQCLIVTPYEKSTLSEVENAIRCSDLGLNPVGAGTTIRVPLPPLTEESRKKLSKQTKKYAENAKVAVRNIRRDVMQQAKGLLKDKEISENAERGFQEKIQKLTDSYILQIDKLTKAKETELMQI